MTYGDIYADISSWGNIGPFSAATLGVSSISRDGSIVSIGDKWFDADGNYTYISGPYAGTGSGTSGSGTGSGSDSGLSNEDKSAKAMIRLALEQFGLGVLADWAWSRYQEGASIQQIMVEVYQRPEFKAEYPEYEILAKKGRAYSVAELQAYRKAIAGIGRLYGFPEGFLDKALMSELAANEVSVAEFSSRSAIAAEAVYSSPPTFRDELHRFYGVDTGQLVAFFLDPDRAEQIIRQQWTTAQISGEARLTGYGPLTLEEAQRLQGLGVDAQAAGQGFADLTEKRELFGAINAGETDISRETQLGAAFGGDAYAQEQIVRRAERRKAEFAGGGAYATDREGLTV